MRRVIFKSIFQMIVKLCRNIFNEFRTPNCSRTKFYAYKFDTRREKKVLKKLFRLSFLTDVVRRSIAPSDDVYLYVFCCSSFFSPAKQNPSTKRSKNLCLWTQQLVLLARKWLLHKSDPRDARRKTWSRKANAKLVYVCTAGGAGLNDAAGN